MAKPETLNLQLSYAECELLQEALADAIRYRSKDPIEDIKTRFDYRTLLTSLNFQIHANAKAANSPAG